MNKEEILGAFSLVNNPIVLSEEEVKDVQKAIKELQQENKKLNGAIQTYDILLKANVEENKQLKDNWNELKKWVIEQEQKAWDEVSSTFGYVLNKMQELEQGKDD